MKCPLLHGNIQKEIDTDIEKVFLESSGTLVIPVSNNFK